MDWIYQLSDRDFLKSDQKNRTLKLCCQHDTNKKIIGNLKIKLEKNYQEVRSRKRANDKSLVEDAEINPFGGKIFIVLDTLEKSRPWSRAEDLHISDHLCSWDSILQRLWCLNKLHFGQSSVNTFHIWFIDQNLSLQ